MSEVGRITTNSDVDARLRDVARADFFLRRRLTRTPDRKPLRLSDPESGHLKYRDDS